MVNNASKKQHAYRESIESKARAHIVQYLTTPPDGLPWWESLKSYICDASREYYQRLLVELIQNGCDALSRGETDGEIWILLDRSEGEHGVLYVANQGQPFDKENFLSINEPGHSNKKPGEGIGHKGVGFRSVLQVCEWPEIYSADPANQSPHCFTGYCFGYARPDDIIQLTDGNLKKAEQVRRNLIHHFLPIPLRGQNATVRKFAGLGMATVIRLPIKTARAAESTEKQIADIRSEGLPVLLFLPHVNRLVIETRAEDGDAETTILTKRTTALTISDTPEELRPECVDLGTLGSYLVAHKRVEPSRLRTSLQESVHEGFIDERWLEWSETAWVSAACRIDADADEHHCYTFLPMRAPSPLAGHLNAPFYTQFARLDLNEDVPLNALLLDVAADLCADTIFLMRNSGLDFAPRVIVDLLTWDSDHTSRIEAAFDSIGASVTDSLIVPIVRSKDGERWGSLTEACRWNDEGLKILTTKRLVKSTDANLVPTELGEARLNRLDAFRRNWFQDVGIEPDPDTKAEWAEAVARHLPSKKESISSWDNFYDDLEHVFEAEGSALIGRKILLDDVFRLQSSGWEPEEKGARRRRAVFFPPAREEAEDEEEIDTGVDVRIPKSLRKHLCFMNEGLSWLIQEGQIRRRKRSRQFLQRERLVRPYRSRDLLDHVTHVLELTKSSRTYRDALRWAFNLFSATRKRQELNFRRIPFKVPCIDGWLPATEALFSGAWEGESGRDLERLIQEAGSVSHEIETLATNLLLPPTEWPFSIADLPAWAEFLRQIGVRAGFWPIACGRENIERQGNMFSPQNLAQGLGLDDTDGARWVRAVNAQNNLPSPSYAHTPYRLQGYFWKLPGQADHERFSPVAKSIYARLIIHGLSHWEESHFQAHIQRPGHPRKPDLLSWPTPLTAFLMGACWAPMTRVGDWHSVDFVPLCEAWHFPDATEDPPRFSPLLPHDIRKYLGDREKAMRRYQEMGGRDWSDPEHAVALVRHLGGIFDALGVAEHHVSEFRKAYNLAWIHCIAEDSSSPFTKDDNSCPIIISRGSVLEAIFPRSEEALDNESVIYVGIEPEALVSHILGTLRFPILRLTGTDQGGQAQLKELNQRLVERLQEAFGDLVQPMSEARIDVLVDEEPFRPGPADPLLIEANTEWLGELIRMGLELWGSSRGTLSARMLQSIDARLRKIRVRKANSIRLRMDKRDAPLPIFLGGVIEIKEDTPTIIVQTGGADYKRECLPGMARSIAHLIGQDGIGDALELALSKLGRITNDTSVNPLNDEDFAGVLSAPVDRVREIRRGYQGRLHALFELLCPVVAHFAGEEAAETFLPTSDPLPDEESVIEVLGEFATTLPMEPKLLVSCCLRTASLPDLRESLRIDYAAFNRTLAKLGPPYRPLHNEEGHRQAFAQFVAQRRPRILDALRKAFLADFDARRPLDGYVARRDLDRLDPDPDWLDICYLPSTDMMEARVNKWLTSTGAQSLGVGEVPLPPYDQIQEENRVLLAELHRRLKTIIPAWLKKFSEVSLPPAWCEGSEGRDQLYRDIEESGILDFRPLTDDDFIRLLIDRGHWPDGMEPTTDLRRLDLADEDLTSQDRQSERERERREFERNSIEIDGHRMSLDRNGARAIADAVVSGVSEEFLSSSSHFSNLTSTGGRGKRESSTKGGSGAQVSVRPTEQQKAAIGLSGEVAAYEWLNRNYRITPDSWKSRNRAKLYGGDPGNDSLGYDFEVRLKSITLMFEVKSSATDAMEIELGDSEVRCAQRYARRDEPYRILFILNVLDAAARRVYILPNPFGPKGRDCYHIVGSGLRYRFQIKD